MVWEFELVVESLGRVTEGPVWDGQTLIFTHIHGNRIMRFDPRSGECAEHIKDTNRTNGLAMDRHGVLYGCMAGKHAIARFESDGSYTLLPNEVDGMRLNRPNDLAIDKFGRIWFSDPFGREFPPANVAPPHQSIHRLDPTSDGGYELRRMTFDTFSPNGIVFSKDERTMYISNGGYKAPVRELRAYPLHKDDSLGQYRTLHTMGRDAPATEEQKQATLEKRPDFVTGWGVEAIGTHRGIDGMCLTTDGNIVATAGWREAGPGPMIYVISPEGIILEAHPTPFEMPTNCTFGDPDLSSLYVTSIGGHLFRVKNTGHRGYLPHLK